MPELTSKCWVLVGSTGWHEDSGSWVTAAFATEALAQERMNLCMAWAKSENVVDDGNHYSPRSCREHRALRCPHDPMLDGIERTGVEWEIVEVEYHG